MDDKNILILCSFSKMAKEFELNIDEVENTHLISVMDNSSDVHTRIQEDDSVNYLIINRDDQSFDRLDVFIKEIPHHINVFALNSEKLSLIEKGKAEDEGAKFFSNTSELKILLGFVEKEIETDEEKDIREKLEVPGKLNKFKIPGAFKIKKKSKDMQSEDIVVITEKKKTIKPTEKLQSLIKGSAGKKKDHLEIKEKVVIREIITTKERAVHTKVVNAKKVIPRDYKKIVAITGLDEKVGKSFVTAALSKILDERKIFTATVDLADVKMSLMFGNITNNLSGLIHGKVDTPYRVSKYLSNYSNEKVKETISDDKITNIINFLKPNNQVILLDGSNYAFKNIGEINQLIYVFDSDPLILVEQIDQIKELLLVNDVQDFIIIMNKSSRFGIKKHELRRKMMEVPFSEAIEIGRISYIESIQKSIIKNSFSLNGIDSVSSKELKYISRVIYPE